MMSFEESIEDKIWRKFFKSVAKKIGANMSKLKKDVKSKAVQERIDADLKEAAKFGNARNSRVILKWRTCKGAYPTSHFVGIVEELKKVEKLNYN